MKVDIPTWEEISETVDYLESTYGNTQQRSGLNPVEQFIYDNEPTIEPDKWRKNLKAALENAYLCEVLQPVMGRGKDHGI